MTVQIHWYNEFERKLKGITQDSCLNYNKIKIKFRTFKNIHTYTTCGEIYSACMLMSPSVLEGVRHPLWRLQRARVMCRVLGSVQSE